MRITFLTVISLAALCHTSVLAQKNEVSLTIGGGRLSDGTNAKGASAFTVSYSRELVGGVGLEGSFDFFFLDSDILGRPDDYGSANLSAYYHFLPYKKSPKLRPYLIAGVGRNSTDFTEFPSDAIYRYGGGVKYYFREDAGWGLRIEVRNEITRDGGQGYEEPIIRGSRLSFVSARAGVSYRF